MRSWDAAGGDRGSPELLRVLRRAVELRQSGVEAEESPRLLLDRLRMAAEEAGAEPEELAAVEALLVEVDATAEPLAVSDLLVRRMMLRFTAGAAFAELADIRRAATLASVARLRVSMRLRWPSLPIWACGRPIRRRPSTPNEL